MVSPPIVIIIFLSFRLSGNFFGWPIEVFGVNVNKLYGPKDKIYKFIGWAGMSDIERIYDGFYSDTDLFLNIKMIILNKINK